MKVTKKAIRKFIKSKLATDSAWALKALVRIFNENQTEYEQQISGTIINNNIGFSGSDGQILSSFAKQYDRYHHLSDKQMFLVHKKMPKYWAQVWKMSDKDKLEKMVLNQTTLKI